MKNIIVLVGCPGSGKSTLAQEYVEKGYVRISQDDMGRFEHRKAFDKAISEGHNIILDRMNHDKRQRSRYLTPAKEAGYKTTIQTFYMSSAKCLQRCIDRKDHPTIKTDKDAASAVDFFFRNYEPVSLDEADMIVRTDDIVEVKHRAVICDIDNTIADGSHRQHYLQGPKKDWKNFFAEMHNDGLKKDVAEIVDNYYFCLGHSIIMCSGRPDEYRAVTTDWLSRHNVVHTKLLMRRRGDYRPDNLVKQIIWEHEIRPYYNVKFVLDDRDQVVKMFREQGLTVLQVEYGNF